MAECRTLYFGQIVKGGSSCGTARDLISKNNSQRGTSKRPRYSDGSPGIVIDAVRRIAASVLLNTTRQRAAGKADKNREADGFLCAHQPRFRIGECSRARRVGRKVVE